MTAEKSLRITVSCSGAVTRGLILASAFDASGELVELHVPYHSAKYPTLNRLRGRSETGTVTRSRIRTYLGIAGLRKMAAKMTPATTPSRDLVWQIVFDRAVSRALDPGTQVLLGESMVSLETMRRARELGIRTVLDRTNGHIRVQNDLVADEYERMGMGRVPFSSEEGIARGEAEYDIADHICTLSSFARDTFLHMGIPRSKVLLVPSATDVSAFRPHPKEDETFRVAYVGECSVKKGTRHLLDAMDLLGGSADDVELMTVGSVDPRVESLFERFGGNLRREGFIRHQDLPWVMSQASVFVHPSLEEGMSKVLLEAMACGIPVIATPNTGAGDILTDGVEGFIVPACDSQAIAEKLELLKSDPDLRRTMGEAARERVSDGFTWDEYAERMHEALLAAL